MKSNTTIKKIMAICLAAAMSAAAFGCSSNKQKDPEVETISLDQTKQDLTFTFNNGASQDATEAKEDATEASEDSQGENAETNTPDDGQKETIMEDVTQYMNVTDADGQNVTDAAGQSVTEAVVVGTRPVEVTGNDSKTTTTEKNNAATDAKSDYTPLYDTCKAYWLDMTTLGDYNFNGEFLTFTFEVKDGIPDGTYPISITYTDIASFDLVQYTPVKIDGEIAVNTDPAKQDAPPTGEFTLKLESQKTTQGATVTVPLMMTDNPGFCGFIIDVQYDANALTIIEGNAGADFSGAVNLT